MAVKQPLSKEFECSICLRVLVRPVTETECCDEAYCQTCIDDWRKKRRDCPQCNKELIIAARPNRKFLNLLSELEFSCDYC